LLTHFSSILRHFVINKVSISYSEIFGALKKRHGKKLLDGLSDQATDRLWLKNKRLCRSLDEPLSGARTAIDSDTDRHYGSWFVRGKLHWQ
jgi:hypothetical protein